MRNDFFNYILECLSSCDYDRLEEDTFERNVVKNFKKEYDENKYGDFDWDYGMTKGVLRFPEENIVIKIPFSYCYDYPITNANSIFYQGEEWDYCEAEMRIYQAAQDEKVDSFFAPIEKIGECKGYPIYAQEYVDEIFLYADKTADKKPSEEAKRLSEEGGIGIDEIWLTDAIKYFGYVFVEKFLSFINYLGVADLHHENIGYLGGKPIVFDYSGYFE